jgi:hypothetical protein
MHAFGHLKLMKSLFVLADLHKYAADDANAGLGKCPSFGIRRRSNAGLPRPANASTYG